MIATQNPRTRSAPTRCPESQLDRFLMRISLGYPDRAAERSLLRGQDRRALLQGLPALARRGRSRAGAAAVQAVQAGDAVLDYLQDLVEATRSGRWFVQGLSPRAALSVLRAAKAHALVEGRHHLAPDDIAAILPQTTAHRLTVPRRPAVACSSRCRPCWPPRPCARSPAMRNPPPPA